MANNIKIKKGLNLSVAGEADKRFIEAPSAEFYAVKPTDFHGLTPKLLVKQGAKVLVGQGLFYDKSNPEIVFASSVSGEVFDIIRGERRKILEVIIKSDGKNECKTFDKVDVAKQGTEQVKKSLLEAGLWPFIKQRPYDVIANPLKTPKSIFVSTFNSNPLAPASEMIVSGNEEAVQSGLNALTKLTTGKVNLGLKSGADNKAFMNLKNVELYTFEGKHPVGNVGVQISNVDPVEKGEVVWTVQLQDVIAIGNLFLKGVYDSQRVVALTGSEVIKTGYYRVRLGTSIKPLVESNVVKGTELRYISGNILTGTKIDENGFLGSYDNQISVIPEGKHFRFMGWAWPGFTRPTVHNVYFSKLLKNKVWKMDTNENGDKRAIVMSGEYDRFVPMDILPEFLIKAIITEDIDRMEQLGIYEIAPEDFALAEYACTSKLHLQEIVRKGLDLMMKELG